MTGRRRRIIREKDHTGEEKRAAVEVGPPGVELKPWLTATGGAFATDHPGPGTHEAPTLTSKGDSVASYKLARGVSWGKPLARHGAAVSSASIGARAQPAPESGTYSVTRDRRGRPNSMMGHRSGVGVESMSARGAASLLSSPHPPSFASPRSSTPSGLRVPEHSPRSQSPRTLLKRRNDPTNERWVEVQLSPRSLKFGAQPVRAPPHIQSLAVLIDDSSGCLCAG